MDTIQKRLAFLVDSLAEGNNAAFARKAGILQGTFQNYMKGREPSLEAIRNIHLAYGVDLNWLAMGKGEPFGQPRETPPHSEADEYAYIPFAQAELAAGDGLVADEGLGKRFAFRRDWLRSAGIRAERAYLMLVRGDSMAPTLQEGDTVLVDTSRRELFSGRIYAVAAGGDLLMVKRLERRGDQVRVISDNQGLYPSYMVGIEDIRVIGQVCWFARRLTPAENGA